MSDKFISFSPWWGGWNNQRMSYETAAAISVITGRKLILPYKEYCLFFSQNVNKSTFLDMWRILDKNAFTSQFDCVDFFDVPEYRNLGNEVHYFQGIEKVAKIINFQNSEIADWGYNPDPSWKEVMACEIEDQKDFEEFSFVSNNNQLRTLIDLNLPDKFIHFPRNLFAHYYYHVYGKNKQVRNEIITKIGKGIRFKKEFYSLAKVALDKLGRYNAIHVRTNDFKHVHTKLTQDLLDNMVRYVKNVIPTDKPLYIATDEKDKELFNNFREHYEIYFQDDFYDYLDMYESLALDHIIPTNAEIFLGSKLSTFTDGINGFRGFEGKPDYHLQGINYDRRQCREFDKYSWNVHGHNWHSLSANHWKLQ